MESDSVRIAGWAREAGRLDPGAQVDVAERAVSRSGWPPFEVRIGYDTAHGRHERTVPKRLARVTRLDVLAAWREGDACCGP
ncbi:MAG: hypothetical protein JNK02_02260 [Planctomycetes bacterium]|nr:hypothetical protein [Planctomycetota bacterium]